MTLSPHVRTWPDGDRVVLFHALTGRHATLSPEGLARLASLPPVRDRLARLHLLDAPLDLAALVPVRSRLVLLLPDAPALWLPVPSVRTSGGFGYASRPLSPTELALWRAVNDARTVAEVARHAGASTDDALRLFATLTAPEVQALQLRDAPLRRADPSLTRLVAAPRPDNARPDDQYGATGETTLLAYHLNDITDGETHFDDRETTVAHALALPHPALDGVAYGERLHDALAARGLVPDGGLVLEIGAGTGELAQAFWSVARRPSRRYVRVDLSPELLRTQARRVPDTGGILADGTRLPLADGSVDLIVNNEVIADLQAAPYAPGAPDPAGVRDRLVRYGLPDRPGVYNTGAWDLVAEIARVLVPGGAACVTEFGDPDAPPEEAVQLDHPEVSIHFGQLAHVARALGLTAELVRLDDLLGVRLAARQLARHSHHALRALCRSRGVHLPARAQQPDTLAAALPCRVEGLSWVRMDDEGPGPLVTRFWALLVRKPA